VTPPLAFVLKANKIRLAATYLAVDRISDQEIQFFTQEQGLYMVSGEPDSVRVKAINGQWIVRIVEGGRLAQQVFDIHAQAESFAEEERLRLGLPGEPPTEEAPHMRRGRWAR